MIVGHYFEGDDDTRTAWAQHDVYHDALHILVARCRDHVGFAVALLGAPWPKRWNLPASFDHRALQPAHDLLAAVWRFRTDTVQPRLPRGREPGGLPGARDWLAWLSGEVTGWREQPRLVALVMAIVAQGGEPDAARAEEELAEALLERFRDVPWCGRWRAPA